jgi:divalent metal cation (Fe/Co/Zn/Cd) transporter
LACFGTGTGWPDVIVATVMAALALHGAITVIREAASELRDSGFAPYLSEGIKPS